MKRTKEDNILLFWLIVTVASMQLIAFVLAQLLCFFYKTEYDCKDYIIEHREKIKLVDDQYELKYEDFYYTDVTIIIKPDSSYRIIYWGDRNSIFWNLKGDKSFFIDFPYNKYKKNNVSADIAIIAILKNIKK